MTPRTGRAGTGRAGMVVGLFLVLVGTHGWADTPAVNGVVPTLGSHDLVEAIDRARSSGEDPMSAVIRALSAYPNAQTTGVEVRAALAQLGISVGDAGAATLANLDRIVKTGSLVTITSSRESSVSAGSGTLTFGKTVKAQITVDRGRLVLDKIEGVSVSAFLSGKITRLEYFKNDAGDAMLRATAKALFLSTTKEINLREMKEKMAREREEAGAAERLEHVGN